MESTLIDETSAQFLGEWQRLVSTTNWDKGRIIHTWREVLIAREAPAAEYSDEAWSRRVGNVTPQHVGRLRRVFERFGETRSDYRGLFWSHFQAALDWNDAEMWLEGAVQSEWSIAQMRGQRWEALGGNGELEPDSESATGVELDEDADVVDDSVVHASVGEVHSPDGDELDESSDDADDDSYDSEEDETEAAGSIANATREAATPVRPFANLPSLPSDVNDAFEAYKLCILRHKVAGWAEISCDDLLASLDSLKELAVAPADVE